jgi:hypothetical protein
VASPFTSGYLFNRQTIQPIKEPSSVMMFCFLPNKKTLALFAIPALLFVSCLTPFNYLVFFVLSTFWSSFFSFQDLLKVSKVLISYL